MSVAQTSITSFIEHQGNGDLGSQQLIVLRLLRNGMSYTDRMISSVTGLERNVVPARRGELVESGFVELAFEGVCPIGRKRAKFWKIKDNCEVRV